MGKPIRPRNRHKHGAAAYVAVKGVKADTSFPRIEVSFMTEKDIEQVKALGYDVLLGDDARGA